MRIGSALKKAADELMGKSNSALLDSEVILSYILNKQRSWLVANYEKNLSLWQLCRFNMMVKKRKNGTPIAYLTGHKEFFGRNFIVNKHVLIPRPETELLIEEALVLLQHHESINNIIDVGTGSGCVAITLALETNRNITATDVSYDALLVAKKNAANHKASQKINFLKGSLLDHFIANNTSIISNGLIISNLPYIKTNELTRGLKYEPALALDGGEDGLSLYNKLLNEIAALPTNKMPSWLLLELHPPTALKVKKIIEQYLPNVKVVIKNDLANLPRIAVVEI